MISDWSLGERMAINESLLETMVDSDWLLAALGVVVVSEGLLGDWQS